MGFTDDISTPDHEHYDATLDDSSPLPGSGHGGLQSLAESLELTALKDGPDFANKEKRTSDEDQLPLRRQRGSQRRCGIRVELQGFTRREKGCQLIGSDRSRGVDRAQVDRIRQLMQGCGDPGDVLRFHRAEQKGGLAVGKPLAPGFRENRGTVGIVGTVEHHGLSLMLPDLEAPGPAHAFQAVADDLVVQTEFECMQTLKRERGIPSLVPARQADAISLQRRLDKSERRAAFIGLGFKNPPGRRILR